MDVEIAVRRCLIGAILLPVLVCGSGRLIGESAHAKAPSQAGDEPGSASATVEQARALVAELESQVERQRAELRRAEANLERARSLLGQLDGRPKQAPQNYPQNNPYHTDEDRRRLPDQAAAEKTEWTWSDDNATAEACARRVQGGYQATVTPVPGKSWASTITMTRDGRTVTSWEGYRSSTFAIGGDVLYRTDYIPQQAGCDVIAYDLKQGKTLWTTHLWGRGSVSHSQYSNRVDLRVDDRHVIVFGNESAGRYIELLDPKTGKTVGQRLLRHTGYSR